MASSDSSWTESRSWSLFTQGLGGSEWLVGAVVMEELCLAVVTVHRSATRDWMPLTRTRYLPYSFTSQTSISCCAESDGASIRSYVRYKGNDGPCQTHHNVRINSQVPAYPQPAASCRCHDIG